jgi:predicted amidohydrolase
VEKVKELPGRYFHTGFVIGPDGLVLRAPKLQAATSTGITLLQDFSRDYSKQFGADALFPVAETPFGRLGCLVANDFLVPEATRMLRKKGAEIIVHPTAEHEGSRHPPYMALRQSQAYTSGVYWLSAAPSRETITAQGKQLEAWYGGGSSIIGPDGSRVAVMKGRKEGHVTARIDLNFLRSCRESQDKHTTPAQILYRDMYL